MIWIPVAFAQQVPAIDAQVFRPSLDNTRFVWVDDAAPANPGPFFGLVAGTGSALASSSAESWVVGPSVRNRFTRPPSRAPL